MEYTFFWKGKTPFSQWYGDWMNNSTNQYDGSFVINNTKYITSEHYMMSEKAKLFGDDEMYQKILNCNHPRDAKEYGRQVKGFDKEKWEEKCKEIVFTGNYAKFTQHSNLKNALLATGNTLLVEASPQDPIWGIGLDEHDAKKMDPSEWPGLNYLGEVLTKVRDRIRLEESLITVLEAGFTITTYRYRMAKTNSPDEYYMDGHDFGEYFYAGRNLNQGIKELIEDNE